MNGGQERQSSLNFYLFGPRPLRDSPKDARNQPPPTNPESTALKLQTFQLHSFFPLGPELHGAVPSGTLIQLVLEAPHTLRQQWYRELPAFSIANYRRESLRMFCEWQREIAEVFLQSQRN